MRRTIALFALLTLGALSLIPLQPADAQAAAAPSLMNFQGRLTSPDGTPVANGTYSLRFSLWDAVTAGNEKWNQTLHSVAVRNGTFAVLLNTNTANLFHSNLWLEIKIGTDAPLTPRQQLVSVAYAMKANSVPDGSIGAAQIANGAITSEKLASGTLNSLAWLLGGNSGANPASQFLGTTDPQPLVFRTNNLERMRIAPGGNVSLRDNSWFEFGAGVAGKEPNAGKIAYQRFTSDSLEFIGAGTSNTNRKVYFFAEGGTTFGGPIQVEGTATLSGFKLSTGAGAGKVLSSDGAGVGTWNDLAALLGANSITNPMIQSVDWSKITNVPASNHWSLGGNSGTNPAANFLGTLDNQPLAFKVNNRRAMQFQEIERAGYRSLNVLGGSELNSIAAGIVGATIAGGGSAASDPPDFPNSVTGDFGTVGGGLGNTAGDTSAATGYYTTVGGGARNAASGIAGTVGGGYANLASGYATTISGGYINIASGIYATVPGGLRNTAAGAYSLAAGQRAQANHNGSFVWNDSTNAADPTAFFTSTAPNQFLIHASGGVGIGTNAPAGKLDVLDGPILVTNAAHSTRAIISRNPATDSGFIQVYNTANRLAAGLGVTTSNNGGHIYVNDASGSNVVRLNPDGSVHANGTGYFGAVGINTNNLGSYALNVHGAMAISLQNSLEFGAGMAGKEGSAGKIGYQIFSGDALDMVGAGTTNANRKITFWAEGGTTFTGNINVNGTNYTSDERYKHHIATLPDGLDIILRLRGVTFDWNREQWKDRGFAEGRQIGFIAQEVEKVLPELVTTDSNGYKSVAYANVVPILVEAVKTLKKDNNATKKENVELKARLEALEMAVQRLTAQAK